MTRSATSLDPTALASSPARISPPPSITPQRSFTLERSTSAPRPMAMPPGRSLPFTISGLSNDPIAPITPSSSRLELLPPVDTVDPFEIASTAGASLPEGLEPKIDSRAWKYIVLHHTATESGDLETIDDAHRKRTDSTGRPWLGIGYHFLIGNGQGMPDGLIEPTFRWTDQLHGAHASSREHNELGIGVCLVGDFTRDPPTPRQIASVRRLVAALVERYGIATKGILRHSDVASTECPGELFPFDEIVDLPNVASRSSAPVSHPTAAVVFE
ncbi:MAG TPA: peptidoglycan recognition family protein [Pirellulales bacterium]|nr:peptidoglycan recognition family protein [Pirellulales bacterium]